MTKKLQITIALLCWAFSIQAQDPLLSGTVMGSSPSIDYNSGAASYTVNQPSAAFDGDLSTFFASYDRTYTWAGMDLGTPHVITRVGWSPRNDGLGEGRTRLAVFEGANRPDFLDAIPLYMTDEMGHIGTISTADVTCSRAFRYVRYVGPNDARCNIAEVQFYGHPDEGDDSQLYRPGNLPVVVMHTVNSQDPYDKENYIPGYITMIDRDGTCFTDSFGIRERGNWSRTLPKKPWRIKFDKKHNVFGSPAKEKSWCLIPNYGDKSLMRNMLAMYLSRSFEMEYTPWFSMVDVFLNGEYKGCYQIADKIDINKNKLNIASTDWLWEIDDYAQSEPCYFRSNKGTLVTIHNPDPDTISTASKNAIQSCFNTMEAAVYASNFANATNGWRSRLDKNSFLSHFLIGEMSGNTDTYWSVYQYKKSGDPLIYTGPVWDFDIAFDNDNRTYPINNKSDYVYNSGGSCTGDMRNFVNRIIKNDTGTKAELVTLWDAARHNGLTIEEMDAYTDSLAAEITPSARLNFMRWDILSTPVHMNPRVPGTYANEITFVKNYIHNRIAWMDRKLGYTYIPTQEDPSAIETVEGMQTGIWRAWNMMGIKVYEGTTRPNLPAGAYVVKQY